MKTVVLQSHNSAKLTRWMKSCLASVENWADQIRADYAFIDDELFDYVPAWVLEKVGTQLVIATDLARLRLMQHYLHKGYERVVWLDADMLVFAPDHFTLPEVPHAVGREVWVQKNKEQLKAYRKVHNAFLMATNGDSFLPFYADTAERLLTQARLPIVPQFIGPKLLTALHNLSGLLVEERAGMLSPLALKAVLEGGGEALSLTLEGHEARPAAFNLSASYCARESDGICNQEHDYEFVIEQLLAK